MKKQDWSIMRKSAPVVLGLFALAALSACSKGDNASAAETAKTETMVVGPENISVATNGSIMTGPSISGTLEPDREAVLRAQVSGSVLQTYADQGQAITDLRNGRVNGVLLIPPDFSRRVLAGLEKRSSGSSPG